MNSFKACLRIEQQGYELIKPYLRSTCDEFIYVNTAKRKDLYLLIQKNAGDLIIKRSEEIFFIDIKTEISDRHGNFFLETWSNKKRATPGWLDRKHGVHADFLYYIFLEQKTLYVFNLENLRAWAYDKKGLSRFPEKKQSRHRQLNDTWGVCVPIDVLCAEIPGEKVAVKAFLNA